VELFYQAKIGPIGNHIKDEISEYCFENGCLGISEDLDFVQPSLTYGAEINENSENQLLVYFSDKPTLSFLQGFKQAFPNVSLEICEKEQEDWQKLWKKDFKPFALAGPYWIVPSWLKKPEEAERAIEIDPGMAFGTGTHETTKMASTHLLSVMTKFKEPRVLDVGTGTGILAILAELEGASQIVAVDNDVQAVEVARENAEINKMKKIEISGRPLASIEGTFEIVVANIVSGVLLMLKRDLIRTMAKGGFLIMTGILVEEENEFKEKFLESSGLIMVTQSSIGEWMSFVMQKPAQD